MELTDDPYPDQLLEGKTVIWSKVNIPIGDVGEELCLRISIKIVRNLVLKYSRVLCLYNEKILLHKPNSKIFIEELNLRTSNSLRGCPFFKKKSNKYVIKGIRLFYKENQTSIVSNNPEELQKLHEKLSEKIIFTNFNDYYKIGLKSGEGKFSLVYNLSCLQRPEMNCAGKFIRNYSLKTKYFGQKAVLNEMNILFKLQGHANIVKLYQVFEVEDSFVFIFEMVRGSSLKELLYMNFYFSPPHIKQIMHGILDGLNHIHKNRIMHRDLKLDNIMIREGDPHGKNVVILDFGLAQYLQERDPIFTRCGSPGYVAPEILLFDSENEELYQEFCDMFSVGVIFHYLLFKCSPYTRIVNYTEYARQMKNCEYFFEFKNELYSKADPLAFGLLKSMLYRDPNKRITAEEALNDPYFLENSYFDQETTDTFYLKGISEKLPSQCAFHKTNFPTSSNTGNMVNSTLGLSTMRRLNEEQERSF